MHGQVGEFRVSLIFSTSVLTQFLRNALFSKTKMRAVRGIGVEGFLARYQHMQIRSYERGNFEVSLRISCH